MKVKTLLLSIVVVIACLSCSKEPKLNDHDTILGSWHIKKIVGLNGFNNSALDFATGEYTFKADGTLEYLNGLRILYKGNWLLYENPGSNYTNADGTIEWIDGGGTVLELDADKTTLPSQKKKAYFINFTITDANNFTTYLCPNGGVTHEYSFVRSK